MADRAEEFGTWLARQLRRKGLSQADLAVELGVSRAAVSAWVSGRATPRIDKMQAIEAFLGLEAGSTISQVDAPDRPDDLLWYPRPAHADGGRELGNAAIFAFEPDLSVLAREATQNSIDERANVDEPVRVRFLVHEISGERLERFREAIRWREIEPHLEAAAMPDQKVGRVLRDGLDTLRDTDSLLLLRIDDYNAAGLTGDEYADGRFAAVVRRQLDSHKSGISAGSYGLGKATLWANSGLGLVLINSTLSEPYGGRSERRLVGRLDLPWHRTSTGEWAGPAWLGVTDPERRSVRSWWGDRQITEDLCLTRSSRAPGTSFLVVGVREATNDLEEMQRQLVEALGRSFWAAMIAPAGGRPILEASVVSLRNDQVVVPEERVDPYAIEPSRSRALSAYFNGETVSEPTSTKDVVQTKVPLRIPRLKQDRQGRETTHEAVLLITEAEEAEERVNRLVAMRGSRMVVVDRKIPDLPMGAPRFQAVLLAGKAADTSIEAESAERFLRTAEPPDHNDWRRTDDLTATYVRGAISRIAEFGQAMTSEIRRVLRRPTAGPSEEGPAELRELLALAPPPQPRSPGFPVVEALSGTITDDGAWRVQVTVKLPQREDPWLLAPVLRFLTRSGPRPEATWARLIGDSDCDVAADHRLSFSPGTRRGTFTGVTDPTSHPVAARMAAIEVDLRHVKETAE